MKSVLPSLSFVLLLCTAAGSAAAACAPDALGTSRVLTLKREYAAYGTVQHGALPLEKGEVVLTFDDGPNPETLDRVLQTLASQCARATFFMTGANLASHPELGRSVVQAGHTPALHSFAHPVLKSMSVNEQLTDLAQGLKSFSDVFGFAPDAYRFPFLDETPAILTQLKERKITVASIDVGIDDYYPNDMRSAAMVDRLVERLRQTGGGIVLMHDANGPTADALPALLQAIRDNGYKVVHLHWE